MIGKFVSSFILLALGCLASPVVLESHLYKRENHVSATFYDVTTGQGACGGNHSPGEHIVAMNTADYAGGSACGKTITITWQGKSSQATVVDECPTCDAGGIDLSEGLFQVFAGLGTGQIWVDWSFGSGAPPAPKPKPTPTSTWKPPPPPTTTSHHTTHTTWSSSSSSVTSSSSAAASASSAAPSSAPGPVYGSSNIANLLQVVAEIGVMVTYGDGA